MFLSWSWRGWSSSNIDSSPVVGDLWHSHEVDRLRKLHNDGYGQDKMCENATFRVELAFISKSHTAMANSKKSNIGETLC